MNPGPLLLALVNTMAAITAPGRPEQHDPPAAPAKPAAPPAPVDIGKALEWAAYAGWLEAFVLQKALDAGTLEQVMPLIDHRRPKP